jgi:hypothetical protein
MGQGDVVAEPLELVDGGTAGAFGVAARVVVGPGIVVERSVCAMVQIATKMACSIATSAFLVRGGRRCVGTSRRGRCRGCSRWRARRCRARPSGRGCRAESRLI